MKCLYTRPKKLPLAAFIIATAAGTDVITPVLSAETFGEDVQVSGILKSVEPLNPSGVDTVFRTRWRPDLKPNRASAHSRARPKSPATESPRDRNRDEKHFKKQGQNDIESFQDDIGCTLPMLPASRVAQLVYEASRQYEVDPEFAFAIVASGSRQNREHNTSESAHEPMGFTPTSTATLGVAERCNPTDTINHDVRLLKSLFKTYRNPLIVAAAFHGGEASVLKYRGIPPFPESVRFVAEVINRQLGLAERRAEAAERPSLIDNTDATDVLAAGESRRWVGGVMQFQDGGQDE